MVSLRARAAAGLLRLQGTRRFYADAATMRARLPQHQDLRRTEPPAALRRTLELERSDVDGHVAWTLRPRGGPRTSRHVLHLHGGGFVEQMGSHHWRFGRWLAETLAAAVTFPMYPLVPAYDHRHIWAVARHAYERFLEPHEPPDRIVTGDSCGGALGLALSQRLRDRGEPQPGRMALFSPWLDLGVGDPLSRRIEPHDPVLGVDGLRQAGLWYAAGTPLDDPEISPAHADLTGLAPIAVFVGTRDPRPAPARRPHAPPRCRTARPGNRAPRVSRHVPQLDHATAPGGPHRSGRTAPVPWAPLPGFRVPPTAQLSQPAPLSTGPTRR
jgi:epsilon-lactone hydrolase